MKVKKLVALTLLAILLLSTFACGGDGEEEVEATPTPSDGTEGLMPTLQPGDRWVYTVTSESHWYTWTLEVTGQEMRGGKDCYVLDASYHPPYQGFIDAARAWYEKATLHRLKYQMSGEYMEYPYILSVDTTYEGSELYPLAVGREFERTETDIMTLTVLGETETETETNTSTYTVERIEDITVVAGTFRCFKVVECDQYGRVDATTWYSDNTKCYVKRVISESGEVLELESYSVK